MLRGSRGVGEAGKKNYSVSRFTERNIAARATAEKAGFVKQAAYRWRKQLTQGEIFENYARSRNLSYVNCIAHMIFNTNEVLNIYKYISRQI